MAPKPINILGKLLWCMRVLLVVCEESGREAGKATMKSWPTAPRRDECP